MGASARCYELVVFVHFANIARRDKASIAAVPASI